VDFRFRILEDDVAYSGRELRSGWVGEMTGLDGDAAAVFFGPCDVATEDLVDLDDRREGEVIRARRMVHVIVEHPECSLATAVLRQRLLVCIFCEVLMSLGLAVRRDGDDVYHDERKLTVSIATVSPVSALIHLGINIDPEGAPVPAAGLQAMSVDERVVATELMQRYGDELESAAHAETKVEKVD